MLEDLNELLNKLESIMGSLCIQSSTGIKKKVKPTLISHIGIPTNNISRNADSAVLPRPLKADHAHNKKLINSTTSDHLQPVIESWLSQVQKNPLKLSLILHVLSTEKLNDNHAFAEYMTISDFWHCCEAVVMRNECLLKNLYPFAIDCLQSEMIKKHFINAKKDFHRQSPPSFDDPLNDLLQRRAYIERLDGSEKNKPDAQLLFSNRQKVSDLFLSFQRDSKKFIDLSSSAFKRHLSLAVRDLSAKLDRRNAEWFANFFLSEYLTINSSLYPDKMSKLERRFSITGLDDHFYAFIVAFDSHTFNQALFKACTYYLSNGKRHLHFHKDCRALMKTVKLFLHVASLIDKHEKAIHFLVSIADHAMNNGTLCMNIWWILNESTVMSALECRLHEYICKSKNLSGLNRMICFHFWNEKSNLKITESSIDWSNSDSDFIDASVCNDFVELGLEHSLLFSKFHAYCTLGIQKAKPLITPLLVSTCENIKKIRPHVQVSGEAFESACLQKRLRTWFWWMYPQTKDILDATCQYLIDQQPVMSGRHERLDAILSAIVPSCWNEIEGNREVIMLFKRLAHEQLDLLSSEFV